MKIAIDIDDTIADTVMTLVNFNNDRYGTKLTMNDLFTHSLWAVWGCTKEEAVRRVYEYNESSYFDSIEPVKESLPALAKLKKAGHDLYAVTGRPLETEIKTREWILRHFPEIFTSTHFANSFGLTGKQIKKSDILRELDIKMLVDDSGEYALDCAEAGANVILIDMPWNQSAQHQNIKRVRSWPEIMEEIDMYTKIKA